jgi:MYXO-CTERM domain-containing protein
MRNLLRIAILCSVALTIAHAGTTTVFDSITGATFSGGSTIYKPASGWDTMWESFTSSDSSFVLTEVDLYLMPGATQGSGSLGIGLYSDNAGQPGTLVSYLTGISDATIWAGGANVYQFTGLTTSVGAGTYWIGIAGYPQEQGPSVSLDPTSKWGYTTTNSGGAGMVGPGVPGNSWAYDYQTMTVKTIAGNGALGMTVVGTVAPEPSTMLLGALGLGALALVRRRRAA